MPFPPPTSTRMLLGLYEALPSLVETRFGAAKASKSLLFSPTEVTTISTSTGVPFQLRYCPTLAKKPTPKEDDATPKKKIDPFENPPPALHVADIPTSNPSHLLVLNKFPIIAEHFILATKANKKQTHLLEQDDLEATYACLKAWRDGTESKLFAFFNSGAHSGASQPHRHLQFLPVEKMHDGEATSSWELLLDLILASSETNNLANCTPEMLLQNAKLPFTHFARSFTSVPSGPDLLEVYNQLYSAANDAVSDFIATNAGSFSLHPEDDDDSPFSYNLAMSTKGMAILPRRAEGAMLRRDDGSDIGLVALNGTTLGGTMMVKHREEWDTLRKRPELLDHILASIGIPRDITPYKSRV